MSVRRKLKTGCALVLAAVLLLTGQGVLETRAAGSVDTKKPCSLTISVDIGWEGGSNAQYLDDLNKMTIPVSVYKVATVNETGQTYTPIEPFSTLDFKISADTTAADWQELAARAKEIVDATLDSNQKASAAGTTPAAISVTTAAIKKDADSTAAASATISGLETGLYLVVPEAAVAPGSGNQYTFTPYLVSLPGLRAGEEGVTNDEWVYNVTVGLKPSMTPPGTPPPPTPQDEYGRLTITKNLQDFNASLGRTTFVFKIVGVDAHGTVKYDEVASLDFDAPGSKSVTLDHIPAGLKVTVTEVYSGASYEVVGSKEQTVTIISDDAVRLSGQKEASVSFTNRYNGKNRVGYGVDNRFKSDGKNGWIWETSKKSASK